MIDIGYLKLFFPTSFPTTNTIVLLIYWRCIMRGPSWVQVGSHGFNKKYKGFSKFIKGNNFRRVFQFLNFLTIFYPKLDQWVRLLRSRRSFRHQDQQNWLMSYFNVICVIRHNMTFYVIWRIWHINMT